MNVISLSELRSRQSFKCVSHIVQILQLSQVFATNTLI